MKVIWRNVKNPRIDLREGDIVVIAPKGTDIDALLKKKREWIDKNLKKIREINARAERELLTKGVRILDNYYRVVHNCRNIGIFNDSVFVCKKRGEFLKEKLKSMLRKDIEKNVENYSLILNIKPERVFIREQSTKWGSCSSKNNLSFNLYLIFQPREFREYVIAHEMVHLIYPNHGREFRRELRELGVSIPAREQNLYYWYYAHECKKSLKLS